MRGGYRQNAGRKKGFSGLEAEKARALIAQLLAPKIESIVNALLRKATKGDIQATRELFDRAWGKSLSATELQITEQKERPLIVKFDSCFSRKFSNTNTKKC